MTKYNVIGMSCAACSMRVEKAVLDVKGVTSCSVNLLTNSMMVGGNAKSYDIIQAVKNAGYEASIKENNDEVGDNHISLIAKRLVFSAIFLVLLLYVSMGHMMLDWPLPSFLNNGIAIGSYELVITTIIIAINKKIFINGYKGLIHKSSNMDTLVAIGATASYVYSMYSLFLVYFYQTNGNIIKSLSYLGELYFESSAMVLTFITVGKLLEAISKGKTTDAIKSLLKLAPKKANIIKDGKEESITVNLLKIGDIFIVKPGENIPTDGVILKGTSTIDESMITGESIPIDKKVGDEVFSATINQFGSLICKVTRVGEDTTLSKIINMVQEATLTKAPIAKVADKVSGIFVPVVMAIAVATFIVWAIIGKSFGFSLERAISVLVISCPCALGLATPVAIMVGSGVGSKNGIMFKNATSLEQTGKCQTVIFDKTGTITKGEPKVTDIILASDAKEEELLEIAYSLEKKSEHPLAKAIVKEAKERKVKVSDITDFKAVLGQGVCAKIGEETVLGGKYDYISKKLNIGNIQTCQKQLLQKAIAISKQGKTVMYFTRNGKILGAIAVADIIKEDSKLAINELTNMGINIVMLTGDNENTAKYIGSIVGISNIISDVKPDEKRDTICKYKSLGKVIMVGDGINDAPSLKEADIGMAFSEGSDISIDAADVILMKNSLEYVATAIRISKATLRIIHQNLFWAFIYNIIGIPLAAGVWLPIFGWSMKPMFGALAMSLSSFCVISNALRLNFMTMKTRSNKEIKNKRKDKNKEKINHTRKNETVSKEKINCISKNETESKEKINHTSKNEMVSKEKINCMSKNETESKEKINHVSKDETESKEKINHTSKNETVSKEKINCMSKNETESKKKINHTSKNEIGNKQNKYKEERKARMEILVNKMMCEHCEMHVKEALEKNPEILKAIPNHKSGTVEIILNNDIDEEKIKEAIEKAGYEFVKIVK